MEKLILLVLVSGFTAVKPVRLAFVNETDLASSRDADTGPDPWSVITCDFDSYSTCGWDNYRSSAIFNWQLGEGKDSHRKRRRQKTGTKDDHGGGGGYMYIWSEKSKNRTAKLATDFYKQTKPGCLVFWYHMRGRHMGHLKLYEFETTQWNRNNPAEDEMHFHLLWSVYGNQGQWWQRGVVRVKEAISTKRKRLIFEAFDWVAGITGNIVLDDISFVPSNNTGDCIFAPSEAAPPEPETTTSATVTSVPDTTSTITSSTAKLTTTAKSTTTIPTTPMTTLYQGDMSTSSEIAFAPDSSTVFNNLTSTSKASSTGVTTPTTTKEPLTSPKYRSQTTRPPTTKVTVQEQTPPSGNGITVRSQSHATIYIVVCVTVGFLALMVALVCFVRYRRRRRFNYYDNCTVHMTRMSPDIVDPSATALNYSKLI